MFFAIELQTSEYMSCQVRGLADHSPTRRASFVLMPNAPHLEKSASFTDKASSCSCASADKPFPSSAHLPYHTIVRLRPPTYVFQHAHPSACITTPWYFCSHRLHLSRRSNRSNLTFPQIVLLGLRDQNLRLLRQARHVRANPPSRGTHTAHEALPSFSSGGPACR